MGRAKPRDRSEEEIHGHRRALDLIHAHAGDLAVTPDVLRRLHRTVQHGVADAGEWKRIANEIIEHRRGAPPVVRFRPVSPAETPAAVEELCLSYRHALAEEDVPPLIAAAAVVFDFLCIHPFRDGNGRVARLLALLTLYHHGWEVGRYISLERLVEESKDGYACPGVSRDMIRRVLADLRRARRVACLGRGPGARWRKEGNTPKRG